MSVTLGSICAALLGKLWRYVDRPTPRERHLLYCLRYPTRIGKEHELRHAVWGRLSPRASALMNFTCRQSENRQADNRKCPCRTLWARPQELGQRIRGTGHFRARDRTCFDGAVNPYGGICSLHLPRQRGGADCEGRRRIRQQIPSLPAGHHAHHLAVDSVWGRYRRVRGIDLGFQSRRWHRECRLLSSALIE